MNQTRRSFFSSLVAVVAGLFGAKVVANHSPLKEGKVTGRILVELSKNIVSWQTYLHPIYTNKDGFQIWESVGEVEFIKIPESDFLLQIALLSNQYKEQMESNGWVVRGYQLKAIGKNKYIVICPYIKREQEKEYSVWCNEQFHKVLDVYRWSKV